MSFTRIIGCFYPYFPPFLSLKKPFGVSVLRYFYLFFIPIILLTHSRGATYPQLWFTCVTVVEHITHNCG